MIYNLALLKAKSGKWLMLPNWEGYFYWDYGVSKLCFRNKEYKCSNKIEEYNLDKRNDWYYII